MLQLDVSNGVAVITFDRPDAFNALNLQLAEAFHQACLNVSDDPEVKVVVLKGNGRAFMAGGDLKAMLAEPVETINALIPPVHAAVELLAKMPKPVLAVVHGAAAGAGLSIALAADFVLASTPTRFSYAYSDIAGSGDAGITWTLPRLIGLRQSLQLAMLGDSVGAEQAQALGMITEAVAPEELENRAQELAQRLSERDTYALGKIKRLMRSAYEHPLGVQLQHEHDAFAECAARPEFSAAIEAFFAKRTRR